MDAAPSSETSSAVEDFKQLPMMNSRTACRKLDEEEDECDGDEDIVTAAGRGAFRIDGGEEKARGGMERPWRGQDKGTSPNVRMIRSVGGWAIFGKKLSVLRVRLL